MTCPKTLEHRGVSGGHFKHYSAFTKGKPGQRRVELGVGRVRRILVGGVTKRQKSGVQNKEKFVAAMK